MDNLPIKALIKITKMRHYLMILSSFILFFSIINIYETGLVRYNLMIGAILFFSSSIVFWFSGSALDLYRDMPDKSKEDAGIIFSVVAFIFWAILIIISFIFFVNSTRL